MPQEIVDTYPTPTTCLHRSKNTSRLSCLNISAIRPQAVAFAREHRIWCTTQTKRERKAEPWGVDVKRGDNVRVKCTLCRHEILRTRKPTFATRLTPRFLSFTSTFQHDDAIRHLLPLPQKPPPTPSHIGCRIFSASTVRRAGERRCRRE